MIDPGTKIVWRVDLQTLEITGPHESPAFVNGDYGDPRVIINGATCHLSDCYETREEAETRLRGMLDYTIRYTSERLALARAALARLSPDAAQVVSVEATVK